MRSVPAGKVKSKFQAPSFQSPARDLQLSPPRAHLSSQGSPQPPASSKTLSGEQGYFPSDPLQYHLGPPTHILPRGTCSKGAAADLGVRTRACTRAHAQTHTHALSPSHPSHACTPTHSLPAKLVPGPEVARRPLTFGEQGGQADEHGGPTGPRRPHLRRAHPGHRGADPPLSGAV